MLMLGLLKFNAQTVVASQPVSGTSGIVSGFFTTPALGTYAAEDFTLASATEITTVTVDGFVNSEDLINIVSAVNLYIYTDNAGLPSGDPNQIGTGVIEIIDLAPTSPALTITVDAVTGNEVISIDITQATGSTQTLTAGTYWLSVVPETPDTAPRWNWFASTATFGTNAVLFDDGNFGGFGWTTLDPGLGLSFGDLNFSIEGNVLSIKEERLSKIKLTPNPADNIVEIKDLPLGIEDYTIKIYTITGKKVYESNNTERIDIGNLNSGIYMLNISTKNTSTTKKLIKN